MSEPASINKRACLHRFPRMAWLKAVITCNIKTRKFALCWWESYFYTVILFYRRTNRNYTAIWKQRSADKSRADDLLILANCVKDWQIETDQIMRRIYYFCWWDGFAPVARKKIHFENNLVCFVSSLLKWKWLRVLFQIVRRTYILSFHANSEYLILSGFIKVNKPTPKYWQTNKVKLKAVAFCRGVFCFNLNQLIYFNAEFLRSFAVKQKLSNHFTGCANVVTVARNGLFQNVFLDFKRIIKCSRFSFFEMFHN